MKTSILFIFGFITIALAADKCPVRCRCVGKSPYGHKYHKLYMKSWIRNFFGKNKQTPGNDQIQDNTKSNGREMICLGLNELPSNIPKGITKLQIYGGKRGLKLIKQTGINEVTKEVSKDKNQIDVIKKDSFKISSKLEDLSIRGNRIKTIHNDAFENLRQNLRKLSLRQNKIEVMELGAIKNMNKLKFLDLSDNRIKELPTGFFKDATNVEVLRLRGNDLECLPPFAFAYMPNLRIIDLSDNKINDLDLDVFEANEKLEELYLSNNKLTDIRPMWFKKLINLKTLRLDGNELNFVPSAAISNLVRLKDFNIRKNRISSIDAFSWDRMEGLNKLDLSDNRIEFIPDETFVGLSRLEELDLGNNQIREIKQMNFKGLYNLKKLILKMNDLTKLEVKVFSELKRLQLIDLSHNIIKNIVRKTFWNLHHLQEIKLDYNHISTLDNLAFGVRENNYYSKITWISLHHNNLTSIKRRAFAGNPHLKVLNVAYNKLTELSKNGFRSFYNLQNLVLNDNKIAKIDPDCFVNLRFLSNLNLANNELKELPKRLFRSTKRFQEIKLAGNYLETLDQQVFKPTKQLLKIDLSRNSFEYFEFKTFLHNQKLTSVNFGKNYLRKVDFSDYRGIHRLRNLDLADNNLETIDTNVVQWVRPKGTIDLHGNPWFCDCNLVWISTKIIYKKIKLAHDDETVCKTPEQRMGRKLSKFTSCEDPKPEPEIKKEDAKKNFLFPEDLTPDPSRPSPNKNGLQSNNVFEDREKTKDRNQNGVFDNVISNSIDNELPQSHSKDLGSIACKENQFQENTLKSSNTVSDATSTYTLKRWHATVVEQSGAVLCGGVRLAENWVLTHAACWSPKRISKQQIKQNEIKIEIGDQNVPGDVNGPWYYVNEVFFPREMDGNESIALVQLKIGKKVPGQQNFLVTYEYPCIGKPDDHSYYYMTSRAAFLLDFTQIRVYAVQLNSVPYLERNSPQCRTKSHFCVRKSLSQFSPKYYDTLSSPLYGKPDLQLLGIKSIDNGESTQKFLDLTPMVDWIDETMKNKRN